MFPMVPYTGFGGYPTSPMTGPFPSTSISPWGPDFSGTMAPFGGFGGLGGFGTDFDRSLKTIDRDLWRMKRDMDRTFRNIDRNFSSELAFMPTRPASQMEHYSLMNPIRYDAQGNRWLNVYFDMRAFKPEEINVTLDSKTRMINVEANHEVKDRDHYIKRSYVRRVMIPSDVNVDLSKVELKSCLTNEGLLCIETPLPRPAGEERGAITERPTNVYPINVKTT